MENKLGLDPAFPVAAFDTNGNMTTPENSNGISQRLYIATMAMQGILAGRANVYEPKDICSKALGYADELLKQENKK